MTDFKKMYYYEGAFPPSKVLKFGIHDAYALTKFMEYIEDKYQLDKEDREELNKHLKDLEPVSIA